MSLEHLPSPSTSQANRGRTPSLGTRAGSLGCVSRAYVVYIGLLAAFWGASYMFIKVANRDFEPATMMLLRLVIAASLLLLVLAARRGVRASVDDMRRVGWAGFALGVVNGAIPFTLIAWGERHVDSGVAAIANASMPIFVVLIALRWQPSERVRGLRLIGFLVGLLGVGVLAGVHPEGGWWGAAGTLAVVVASASYAVGSIWGQRLIARTSGLTLAATTMIGGAIVLLPFGLLQLPSSTPGWKEIGSVLALAIIGTALAQIILYRVLRSDGAARVSLVTYLLPVTALFYGVTLLGEPLTWEELAGMALILSGVALGSGAVRFPRREPIAAPSP
jgi:drug/metabolite transporter (DMT)-like permease